MGNTLPQLSSSRSGTSSHSGGQRSVLRKTQSLRGYSRNNSISNNSTRKNGSITRPRSMVPTDAEIVDVHGLTFDLSEKKSQTDNNSTESGKINQGEIQWMKKLEYIRSCVRKDKGLFGMMTENLQCKHIFSNHEPENTHTLEKNPDDYSMEHRSLYLQTPDGEFLHAYWIYQNIDVNSTSTLLYLHGAGGNVSHRLEVLRLFYDNLHCNILIIDYRGFGKSTGSPSELGLYIDAQTAYDYLILKQKILPENIIVFGTSLGASVAVQLVSDPSNRAKLAIFENAFVSVPEVAKYFLTYAKNVIGVTKSTGFIYLFDSLAKVRRIECPCLYLTGLLDPIIPTWMSNTLYNETRSAKKRHIFEYPFGKHNDLPIMPEYFDNIHSFINELPLDNRPNEEMKAER